MFKKKSYLFMASLLAVSLFVVACANDDDNGDDNGVAGEERDYERDTLRVGVGANINTLDLHATNDTPSSQIHRHIFETLIVQDHEFELHPGLATEWEELEGNRYQFTLQQGVYFHNGDPMTAHDVAFTMTRAADAPHVAPILGMIDPDSIEIVDDHTIIIGTEIPFAPFLSHLAHPAAGIMNAEVVGDIPVGEADVYPYVVGTGPYVVAAQATDDFIRLERWEDYHGDLPNMREIHFDIMPDQPTRLMALEARDVDMIINPAFSDVERMRNDNNINFIEEQSVGIEYMGMNMNHEYLGIQEVRQAINYVLDTEEIVSVATEGTGNALRTFIPNNVFGYDPALSTYEQNIARAQELMEEAGLEDGFEIELLVNNGNAARLAAATIIQAQLAEINITATIDIAEWAAYLAALDSNDFDAFFGGWGIVSGDADYALYPLLHSNYFPASNRVGIDSPEIDQLLLDGRSAATEEERLEIYFELLETAMEIAPFVLLQNNNLHAGMVPELRGFILYPHQGHFWGNVYFVTTE